MKKITAHILTHNNIHTLEAAIKSIAQTDIDIIIGDFGSNDGTLELCQKYNLRILNMSNLRPNEARNQLVNESFTDWQLYIEPYETMETSHDEIYKIISKDKPYKFYIMQEQLITKQVRLWNKKHYYKFINPIYEYLDVPTSEVSNCIIKSKTKNHDDKDFSIIDNWIKEDKLLASPYYYKACLYLTSKKYKEFLAAANQYLFNEKNRSVSWLMTKYYKSMVLMNIMNNITDAIKEIQECIRFKPDMAEFWCLLGDVCYYKTRNFKQALKYYEHSLSEGSKRNIQDDYPIEPKKYKEYPNQKIKECSDILSKTKLYTIT